MTTALLRRPWTSQLSCQQKAFEGRVPGLPSWSGKEAASSVTSVIFSAGQINYSPHQNPIGQGGGGIGQIPLDSVFSIASGETEKTGHLTVYLTDHVTVMTDYLDQMQS